MRVRTVGENETVHVEPVGIVCYEWRIIIRAQPVARICIVAERFQQAYMLSSTHACGVEASTFPHVWRIHEQDAPLIMRIIVYRLADCRFNDGRVHVAANLPDTASNPLPIKPCAHRILSCLCAPAYQSSGEDSRPVDPIQIKKCERPLHTTARTITVHGFLPVIFFHSKRNSFRTLR